MLKRFCLSLASLLLLSAPVAQAVDITPQETLLFPVIITEIYPNAPNQNADDPSAPSTESGGEYIEIHNQTAAKVVLDGYRLGREGNTNEILLDGLELAPGDYLAIITSFSLVNSGGNVFLYYPGYPEDLNLLVTQSYPSFSSDELHSWSLVGDEWAKEVPTPSEANPLPEIEEEEDEGDENESLCQLTTVFINEIVANPAGSDSAGGEFVELYNDGNQAVNLEGCIIKTDKLSQLTLPSVTLETGGYYVVELLNDLLNSGGSVTLITAADEQVVTYPSAGDDDSWSIINGEWQATSVMTPGAQNQPTPEEVEVTETKDGLGPCPEGKFRNPETNRCKNIVDTASSLLPCDPGEARNPETNRCRKTTSITSTLKPCGADQERNPETNRCRKIASATSELKPCDEGEERNPDTNRCRKAGSVLSGATIDPPTQEAGIHTNIFMVMTLLAMVYGIYEYRLDFINWRDQLKERFAAFRTS